MMFGNVPVTEWRLHDRIGEERKKRLLDTPFESIVQRIVGEARLHRLHCEPCKKFPGSKRIEIGLTLCSQTVDLFHNGAGGYRAQFYQSIRQGEAANQYVTEALLEKLKGICADQSEPGCSWEFIEASLRGPDAKAWIFEGDWFHGNKPEELRNLTVDRWVESLHTIGPALMKLRFERSHPMLTPDNETRLDLKGGCIDGDGNSIGKRLKPCRSQEIHDFGYT